MIKNMMSLLALLMLLPLNAQEKLPVDLLVHNAKVYTVNGSSEIAEAFVVRNGRFVAVGKTSDLKAEYAPSKTVDAQGKNIFPGFIDAHAHFVGLANNQLEADLVGTKSFEEVVEKVIEFQDKTGLDYVIGSGWDQNDWERSELPTKDTLDLLFPDIPVFLFRIDGHAALVNQKALDEAGITPETKTEGGEIEKKNGKLTGILVDNPMGMLSVPPPSDEEFFAALNKAEEICFSNGLTTLNEAGISSRHLESIDSLQQAGILKMRIYAMLSAHPDHLEYLKERGPIKTDFLNVRSFKFMMDGALGSRGAALKEPYSDRPGHFGALGTSVEEFKSFAAAVSETEFQLNTHAIGDSANYVVLKTYDSLIGNSGDRRWKIEHAQVIAPEDFDFFSNNIIPSVQPTHATSDMYWAHERLGKEREKGAYAYKKLLDQAGIVALGTDFPVERVNPFLTFYAAVARKDTQNYPEGGYMKEQALSREEALKGMTIWAAFSNFEENEKGSIEEGKFADFIILDRDIMEIPEEQIPETNVLETYLGGKKVY